MSEQQVLLNTITGELYQPARLYYQVFKKNAVVGRFNKLHCIQFEESRKRWLWLYTHEAKGLKFEMPYQKIPKEYRPIVLGSFEFRGEREIYLDVSSFERVVHAVLFFDRKINRALAKVSKLKIVNKLFSGTEARGEMQDHHTLFFEQHEAVNPKDEMAELQAFARQYEDIEKRREAVMEQMERMMKQPLPEVEELDINYYEEGIKQLETSLQVRQLEAVEHWKGNKKFSQFDILQKMLNKLS